MIFVDSEETDDMNCCNYCGYQAVHGGMCYQHSVLFNGAERAAQLQEEHDAREAAKDSCASCGKPTEECEAEKTAIQEQNEEGGCSFGPDCAVCRS